MSTLRHVLVVDPSKLVRATLVKHLKDNYLIREEGDGESAWQTLVLDSSIAVVISGASLPQLSTFGLLERLRENRLRRLNEMPFLLLVSGAEHDAERDDAMRRGVSGFVTKTMGRAEILSKVTELTNPMASGAALEESDITGTGLTATDVCGGAMLEHADAWPELKPTAPTPEAEAEGDLAKPLVSKISSPDTALLSAAEIEAKVSLALSAVDVRRSPVSLMVLGIDHAPVFAAEYGIGMLGRVGAKIAKLLRGKLGTSDAIGQLRPGCLAIVARGTALDACAQFAERVCRSMASAQIGSEGNRFPITVSAGITGAPFDGALNGVQLLVLAHRRFCEAVEEGGNRVVASGAGRRQTPLDGERLLNNVLTLLRAGRRPEVAGSLASAGLEVMPLLLALDAEFRWDLPLEKMMAHLEQRAITEGL